MQYYIKIIFTAVICIFEVYMYLDFIGVYAEDKQNLNKINNSKMKQNKMKQNKMYQNKKRRNITIFSLTAAIFILNLFENSILNLCCVPVLYLTCSGLLFEMKVKSRIFYVSFYYIILAGIEIVSEILIGLLNRGRDTSDYSLFQVIGIVLTVKTLTFVLLKFISRTKRIQERYYEYKLFWLFLILPLSSFMMYGSIFYYDLEGDSFSLKKIIIVMACFALLLSNAIVFYVFETLFETMYKTKEMELIHMKNHMEYEHYKQLEVINKEHGKYIHDMKHYVDAISQLIHTGDFDEADDVLQKINIKSEELENMRYCSNSILNAVLCEKGESADIKGIFYDVSIEKGIGLTYMDSLDIIAVFGNLIDNAIEAAARLGDKGYVKIELFLAAAGNFVVLKVKNNYVEKPVLKKSGFVTNKKDKKYHGIGLKSVKESIMKYGGILNYNLSDEEFEADVMLSASMVECMDNMKIG